MDIVSFDEPVAGLENVAVEVMNVLQEKGFEPDPNVRMMILTDWTGTFATDGVPLFNVTVYLGANPAEVAQDVLLK